MGERGGRITRDIAYPGQWMIAALERVAEAFDLGPDGFRDLCRFKWSFNIKPDLVLRVPETRALCIEAKLESKDASYPVRPEECAIFDRAAGERPRVGQLELQRFMFEHVLGEPCQAVVIDNARRGTTAGRIQGSNVAYVTWAEVFDHLDASASIPFVRQFLGENRVYREPAAEGG